MGKEADPRAVFNRLLGDPRQGGSQQSILDAVMADAQSLRARLGQADRRKLDEYVDSIRAVERRIEFAERHAQDHRPPEVDLPDAVPSDYQIGRAHV